MLRGRTREERERGERGGGGKGMGSDWEEGSGGVGRVR